MRTRFLAALGLAALVLTGCETYPGPTATCFNLVEGGPPCDFRPLAGVEGFAP